MKPYHNGPISNENRSCTDVIWLILFILFNLVMLIFGIYSWSSGNFDKLTTPYDPDGKGCGTDHPDYPLIYFASPHSDSLWVTVCLKTCPKQTDSILDCKPNSVVTSCSPNNNADNTKAVQIYDTTSVRGTICFPTSQKIKSQVIDGLGLSASGQKLIGLSKSWVVILISVPVAILLSLLFMFIIQLTAGFLMYFLLGFCIVILIALGVYLFVPPSQNSTYSTVLKSSRPLSILIGVISIILALIIIIMLICYRKRLKLASSIIKVSARFVYENCPILFLPLILFLVMMIFLAIWILQALGYYSLGNPTHEQHNLPFQHFEITSGIKALALVHIFYLFWTMFFLIETGDFIISGTVASWYFQQENPYKQSTSRYTKFHIGSVCAGSFLLAVLGFLKFIYELLTIDTDKEEGCLSCWKKFCNCCCYVCLNYLFNCFNSGAYAFIHLAGQTYCTSAFEVLGMKAKQLIITGVVIFLGVLFSIIARIGITASTCLLTYLLIKNVQPYKSDVSDPSIVLLVIGILAFTIASFFVSVYSQAMESVYVCYLVDIDAGGGEDKCPQELKSFLDEAKKQGKFIE